MGPGYQRSTTHGLIRKVTKITIFDAQRYSWEHFSKILKLMASENVFFLDQNEQGTKILV